MAQLNSDGVRSMSLSRANENGGLNTPPTEDFNTPAMQGSIQQVLSENLGTFVVVEFLIGTQTMEEKSGVLYAVGRSFLTLFEEESQTFVVCDIFSVKFITFYLPGRRPQRFQGPFGGTGGGASYPTSSFGSITTGPGGGVLFSSYPGMEGVSGVNGAAGMR